MKYEPYYQDEIINIIEIFEEKLKPTEHTEDLENTQTLCYCFLLSINQMIRGAFGALSNRSLLGFNMISRTIIEHIIDLYYIALSNNRKENRRFANHHKLILYNIKDEIEHFKSEIPKIENDYRSYIKNEFPDVIKYKTNVANNTLEDWDKIDKDIFHKFKSSWTGKNFNKRVKEIKEILDEMKKLYPKKHINISHLIEIAKYYWETYSSYIHPSPFSAVPHFVAIHGTFHLNYSFSDETFKEKETLLLFTLCSTIDAFTYCSKPDEKLSLMQELKNIIKNSNKISKLLLKIFPHATRTCDK